MVNRRRKRSFISISSDAESKSADEQEDSEKEHTTTGNSFSSDNDDDDDDDDYDSEWSADEEEKDDSEEEGSDEVEKENRERNSKQKKFPLDDQALYNRIVDLLKSGNDLQSLKLEDCKVYLRKHDLRLSGTKAVCIQRIQEHWRIKDGGERLYPRSSFRINCTGDVCKGDVVLFKQRVYERFDKASRSGKIIGKRTIAGRIVKESYGAAKQQHTFTVEVLWSSGVKKLPPLFPLLVKGRNLYRMRTFRQRWNNEEDRAKVLDEKHKRGTEARNLRAMKKAYIANRDAKCRKQSDHSRKPPQKRQRKEDSQPAVRDERNHDPSHGKATWEKERMTRTANSRATKSSANYGHPTHYRENEVLSTHHQNPNRPPGTYYGQTQHQIRQTGPMFHANRETFSFPDHQMGSTSRVTRIAPPRPDFTVWSDPQSYPYINTGNNFKPRSINHFSDRSSTYRTTSYVPSGARMYPQSYPYVNTGNNFKPRSINHFPDRSSTYSTTSYVPSGARMYNRYLYCSTAGCRDQRDDKCVGLSCWSCCRRSGRGCHRHQLHPPF